MRHVLHQNNHYKIKTSYIPINLMMMLKEKILDLRYFEVFRKHEHE